MHNVPNPAFVEIPAACLPKTAVAHHRILLDCTETCHATLNTGIERTVRNIIGALLAEAPERVECVAVAFDGNRFAAVDSNSFVDTQARMREPPWREWLRTLVTRGYRSSLLRATLLHPVVLSPARQLFSHIRWTQLKLRRAYAASAGSIEYRAGDWIVLLDSNWGPDLRAELARAKAAGGRIGVVIYDLIKIRHPELVSPGASAIYRRWFARTVPMADRVVAISRAVRDDVRAYLRESGLTPSGDDRVGWFHLGSDLAHSPVAGLPSAEFDALFEPGHAVSFLVVGTLEPRKAQHVVLDAFESRWSAGDTARLVLVGREGWGSHALTRRLRNHRERGRRLIWLERAGDADLETCYRHAAALIIASTSEGFGLPIAEALQRGVPVIASDIPVFREVGGDAIAYVRPADSTALAAAIAGVERGAIRPLPLPAAATRSWAESARSLVAQLEIGNQ